MSFKQCSNCKGYCNDKNGGGINPECAASDRARVAKIVSTPVIPKLKPKRPATKPPTINKLRSTGGIGSPPKEKYGHMAILIFRQN